jgi:hypothetical protein
VIDEDLLALACTAWRTRLPDEERLRLRSAPVRAALFEVVLEHGDWMVRRNVTLGLGALRVRVRGMVPRLVAALESAPDDGNYVELLHLAGGRARAAGPLLANVVRLEPRRHWYAIPALAHVGRGERAVTDFLLALLDHEDRVVAALAAQSLGASFDDDGVIAALEATCGRRPKMVQHAARKALERIRRRRRARASKKK